MRALTPFSTSSCSRHLVTGSAHQSPPTTSNSHSARRLAGQCLSPMVARKRRSVWNNKTSAVTRQSFARTERRGLSWMFEQEHIAAIAAELIPTSDWTLLLLVRVTNHSASSLSGVDSMNCFQFSAAPDFDCDDFSRIYIRSQGQWQSLAALRPTCGDPYYYRTGYRQAGGAGWMHGMLSYAHQPAEADHPLIVCVSGMATARWARLQSAFSFFFTAKRMSICIVFTANRNHFLC